MLGILYQSIGNYSLKGIIRFIVTDGKGEDRQCQVQIPVVIVCGRSVNELLWTVMDDHICALLVSKLVTVWRQEGYYVDFFWTVLIPQNRQ